MSTRNKYLINKLLIYNIYKYITHIQIHKTRKRHHYHQFINQQRERDGVVYELGDLRHRGNSGGRNGVAGGISGEACLRPRLTRSHQVLSHHSPSSPPPFEDV
ncbi:hypothetical protein HanIR_Chr17g0862371 [Helianthus annuus]|nr:hypothetical protein HanIR_Chr17g0862371 [Helianthus annuus]